MKEYLIILIPGITGIISTLIWKVDKNSGKSVNFRPPAVVFSIIWPILYLLFGLAWFYSRRENRLLSDLFYSILTFLLCLWIFVYSKNKINAIYVLLLSLLFCLLCYSIGNITSRCLISPLLVWILFAMLLNIFEVSS